MTVRVEQCDTIHKGRVFDITVENLTFPNGFNVNMEIIRHPGASAIVPILQDNRVLLLKQYRHAIGGYLWEIPAGTFDGQEAALACARRELTEETGHTAQSWDALGTITPLPGYSDERIHIFLARDLTPTVQKLDQDELLEVHAVPFSDVVDMICRGAIEDAKTIAAIFLAQQKLDTIQSSPKNSAIPRSETPSP